MGNKKSFELEFFNEKTGQMDVKFFDIHFISQNFMRRFDELKEIVIETKLNWDKIGDNNSMIAALRANGSDSGEIKKYVDDNAGLIKKINRYEEYPKKRMELIIDIFRKNGITDPDLLSDEFLDNNMDSGTLNILLSEMISKDIEKKNSQLAGNFSPGPVNRVPDEKVQH